MSEDKVVDISHRELTLMEHLDQWIRELIFPGDVEEFVQQYAQTRSENQCVREFCIYTDEYNYYFHATERYDEKEKSYINCHVNARKKRAGEHWPRANELPEGPFNKETWNRIIYSIVNYELVKLSPFQKPDSIPEDVA
jgi:hypothetical protein